MPCDYSLYPPNWRTEIRPRILERAMNRCERCGAINHAWISRNASNLALFIYARGPEDRSAGYRPPVRVVLTVAHLNHDVTDNRDSNLAAWCQLCHLRHDAKHHARNAAATRHSRKAAGELLEVDV